MSTYFHLKLLLFIWSCNYMADRQCSMYLKQRLFHKFAYLQANSIEFHSQCELCLTALLYFSLSCIPHLLYNSLNTASFCYLFQAGLKLLFLFVLLQHFLVLLFKHVSISLKDVRRQKDMMIQEKDKKISFYLYIIDQGTITGSSDKLNRILKA